MRDVCNEFDVDSKIHLDFYGLERVQMWLSRHNSVILWLNDKINKPNYGWKPFDRWSLTPREIDDTFILKYGISVKLPIENEPTFKLEDGVNKVRKFIKNSKEAVRIVGQSGVGKTRFVQALFEQAVGVEPLNHQDVIYADMGIGSTPTPIDMIDRLIKEEKSPFVVLDNCSVDLHSKLNKQIVAANSKIKLITIEFDTSEELSNMQNVVLIKSCKATGSTIFS